MEINEYKKIKNKTYSPKEVLAHLVICKESITSKDFKSIMVSLEDTFLKNINNKKLFENLSMTSLRKIKNYWTLSVEQAIAYGIIVFYFLYFEDRNFNEREITDMFEYAMRLYSPDNAVDFVKNKLNKKTNI